MCFITIGRANKNTYGVGQDGSQRPRLEDCLYDGCEKTVKGKVVGEVKLYKIVLNNFPTSVIDGAFKKSLSRGL